MATKQLGFKNLPAVTVLPTPSAELEGVLVKLASDKKPYYCNGSSWVDLSATGAGGGGSQQVFVQATAPAASPGVPYLWFQTGMGDDGTGFTLWIGDGL